MFTISYNAFYLIRQITHTHSQMEKAHDIKQKYI